MKFTINKMYFIQSPQIGRNQTQRIKSPNPNTPQTLTRTQTGINSDQKLINSSQQYQHIPRAPIPMFKSGHTVIGGDEVKKLQIENQRLNQLLSLDDLGRIRQENQRLTELIMQKNYQISKYIKIASEYNLPEFKEILQ